jgi:signal transduction histidine kinase
MSTHAEPSTAPRLLPSLHWMDWLGLATIVVVAGLIFLDYPVTDGRRWWALLLLAAVVVTFFIHVPDGNVRNSATRYLFLTGLSVALFLLNASITGLIVLYFVLSGEIMSLLPWRQGILWVTIWGALTCTFIAWSSGDVALGVLNGLGSYLFLGSAASAQRRAENANAESQRLLAELQTAHRQLQEYAARAEEFAITQERNRLAREVHDTLGHRLTVAAVQLEGAGRLVQRDPAKATAMVETVRQQVLEGLSELRRTVAALRAPLEEELSLPNALTRLAHQFEDATGIHIQLDLPAQTPPLPPAVRQALYRTAQEALTNVQRHSGARQVWLAFVAVAGERLELRIADDGKGLTESIAPSGYGLRGLQERAEQLHGTVSVRNRPGGGTLIHLTLPWPATTNNDSQIAQLEPQKSADQTSLFNRRNHHDPTNSSAAGR